MKRRIGTLLSQELIVAARSRFYLFIFLIFAVSTAAVYFIPEEIGMPGETYIYDAARASDEAVGAEQTASAAPAFEIRTLESAGEPMDNSIKLLLVLLAFEVVVIGYLFSAAVIFQEKQEGTVRAFRVTPGSAGVYLTAKTIFWTAAGVLYGALMLFTATLFSLSSGMWLQIMSAVVLSSLFYTLLGIGIAVYFTTISEWFIIGVMVLIINMLPILALEFPAISNPVLKWIPSHPFIFWLEEVFRGSAGAGGGTGGAGAGFGGGIAAGAGPGGWSTAAVSAGKLALFAALGAGFAFFSVRRKIMKEGGK
jgi:hypothetical protein